MRLLRVVSLSSVAVPLVAICSPCANDSVPVCVSVPFSVSRFASLYVLELNPAMSDSRVTFVPSERFFVVVSVPLCVSVLLFSSVFVPVTVSVSVRS